MLHKYDQKEQILLENVDSLCLLSFFMFNRPFSFSINFSTHNLIEYHINNFYAAKSHKEWCKNR